MVYRLRFENGKIRIQALYDTTEDKKERADFLKKEYGTGGKSYRFADGSNGFIDYDAKGIDVEKYGLPGKIHLSWAKAEEKLDKIIQDEKYLTPEEAANSHFLRTAGPHSPDSPGHIKRTVLEISRAERGLRPANQYRALSQKAMPSQSVR